ncbi:HIT family protein [Candidatus Woesearchaeota archaeon]|nr:HIT family protein [Candidatus Woesearchaeota archaeon]
MDACLFCKIISGEIPSHKVYEDEKVFAFLDINPVNKGHVLVVPKNHSTDLVECSDEDLCSCMSAAKKIGSKQLEALGAKGFNTLINTRPASGQIIYHTHIHVIPRFEGDGFKHWHGKSYSNDEERVILEKLRF